MARILISYYKVQELGIGKILAFWDGLFQEFKKQGNDVFVINTAYFNSYNQNTVQDKKLNSYILSKVKEFDPELIITFNHRIPQCILENFKDVPTVIWDGDELKYFCDLSYIKENIGRYKLFSIVENWSSDYREFGFAKNQIFSMPPATAIESELITQDKNISFLGGIHYDTGKVKSIISSHKYEKQLFAIQQDFLNNPSYDFQNLFQKYFQQEYDKLGLECIDLYSFFNYRWLTLSNLLDLGLHISGMRWDEVIQQMPQLAVAFSKENIWSLKENEDFYNSSKISISPIHPQARGSGFPWRIYDVMASNACLVSEYSSDLIKLTKSYVDIPMFKTPWEARDICKELLVDEKTRKEIVVASQRYVDANARWIHRFKQMQEILGITIVNIDGLGNYTNINQFEEFHNLVRFNKSVKRTIKLKDKMRLKLWKHLNKKLKKKNLI